VSGAGWRGLVVGLVAITVAVIAFYWVLMFSPHHVTTTVTVTAPLIDGGGLGRVLDVCFSWSRRCDEMAVRLIDSARSRVLVAAYSLKNRWIAEALIKAYRRGVEVKVVLDASQAVQEGPNTGSFLMSRLKFAIHKLPDGAKLRLELRNVDQYSPCPQSHTLEPRRLLR
jgi:phosphatidylserine/phosphatidylglycerophosphate/cardiolipin synthase-like enzyme